MPFTLNDKLVVAVASRALFDFEAANQVYESGSGDDFAAYQLERLDQPAEPGVAYPLIRKLLRFNTTETQRVEVVILSRNDPVSGMRVFRSAQALDLPLQRGVFTQGRASFPYLKPLRANLFLSANVEDVQAALAQGFPAALVYPESRGDAEANPDEVRIAFDGDSVLFSDEAERVFQQDGLEAFQQHERSKASLPMPPGPFQPFLAALNRLREANDSSMRLRIALVTARSAPAHERAIRTLMSWNLAVDEAMFLGGLEKGPFLAEFKPDFFLDDQTGHCQSAARYSPTGLVMSGVTHEKG